MQGNTPIGEEAGQWLREHFADDPNPHISITWTVTQDTDPAADKRLLEILFGPQPHTGQDAA